MIKLKHILFEAIVGDKIECDNCTWSWEIKDGGDDLYICHKCGHDNTPKLQEKKMIKLKSILTEASLATNIEFRDMVKTWEGTGPTDKQGNHLAYDDAYPKTAAKPGQSIYGTLTIGYGTTESVLPNLKPGLKITPTKADTLLTKGIQQHESKARRLMPKYDTYPDYVRKGILNAIYRGDMGPATIKLINAGKWAEVSKEYLDHANYKNPGGMSGVVARMKTNADAFDRYATELANPMSTRTKSQGSPIEKAKTTGIVKVLYPKDKYVNVRTTPAVNTGFINNLLLKIDAPNRIGVVRDEKLDDRGITWYWVKLTKGITRGQQYGWVRSDVVISK